MYKRQPNEVCKSATGAKASKRNDWSVVVMADIVASVLAKLKNKAKASGISYQQCLQLFVQEEFLRKLSKSGYEDNLILKGGLFIYTLTNFESRATIDVDFLLRAASNSIEDVKELINKVINTPTCLLYTSRWDCLCRWKVSVPFWALKSRNSLKAKTCLLYTSSAA